MLVALALFAASLVVAAAVVIPRVVDELSERNSVTSPPIDDPALAEPSLEGVLVVADLSTEHRDDEDVDYEQVPPAGGPARPGVAGLRRLRRAVRDENAVHDLEHGTVWITYDPDLGAAARSRRSEEALPDERDHVALPGAACAGRGDRLGRAAAADRAEDPRLPLFIEEYGDGGDVAGAVGSCEGGHATTRRATGGRRRLMHRLTRGAGAPDRGARPAAGRAAAHRPARGRPGG